MFVRLDVPRVFGSDLLEDLLTDFTPAYPTYERWFPAIDVAEYENQSVVVAELPGVRKEDLKIAVENGVLTISGERKPYEIPQNARVLINEMRVMNFRRSIELPHEVEIDKISAELQNGVLRITLPKTEASRAHTIAIQ
ncbi:MAG TPA: Hsp20/alpha crystallin family protein [Bacteroidota bacterium]|nr:Hsp20/alpha crystallin family protein [Bacteroidota bacterium]